jgi:hypothetical protein
MQIILDARELGVIMSNLYYGIFGETELDAMGSLPGDLGNPGPIFEKNPTVLVAFQESTNIPRTDDDDEDEEWISIAHFGEWDP